MLFAALVFTTFVTSPVRRLVSKNAEVNNYHTRNEAVISIIEVTAFFVFSHPLFKYSIIVALLQSFEKSGNVLFKYRGQIPALIFLLAIPILFFSNSDLYMQIFVGQRHFFRIVCIVLGILTSLAGLVLRAYTVSTTPKGTSGRNTAKQVANSLNTKGIYSVVRHPLYLANYLLWAGILIFSMNIWAFIIVSLVYWIYYERIMFAEEAFLRNKFGKHNAFVIDPINQGNYDECPDILDT